MSSASPAAVPAPGPSPAKRRNLPEEQPDKAAARAQQATRR